MPQAVNDPEDIAMVREFFASLSRSERLRMYDFFKNRIGSAELQAAARHSNRRFVRILEDGYQNNREDFRPKV